MDSYQVITDRMISLLEQGVVPWHKPWAAGGGGCPKNLVSGKAYRGSNVFILACSGYESPYWLTYKQARKRGGYVRRGQKGTQVVFWKFLEVEDPGTGKAKKIPMLRHYTVFNAEQCGGVNAPESASTLEHGFDPIARAEEVVEEMPGRPEVRHGEPRAFYRLSDDLVNMPKRERFSRPEEYYSTLFHELTHATGHSTRLGRLKGDSGTASFGSGSYSREELVAEMGAAFLSGDAGIVNATIDNSAAYIAAWLRRLRDDKKLVIMAAAQAQKAADYILDRKFD